MACTMFMKIIKKTLNLLKSENLRGDKMTAAEKWNKICDFHKNKKYINASEKDVQKLWETLFSEIMGYSKLNGEIDDQRKIQFGSRQSGRPDIIIKDDSSDLFVIELKRHCADDVFPYKQQLFSYLKQLKNEIGILICKRLCLFDYNYTKPDSDQMEIEISFEKNNPIGIKFIEIFCKGSFQKEKAKSFIQESAQKEKVFLAHRDEIKAAVSSENSVKQILSEYFTGKGYTEEEVDSILKTLRISSESIQEQPKSILENHCVPNDTHNGPEIKFFVNRQNVSQNKFKDVLLTKKVAKRTFVYSDGREEEDSWAARKFTGESNLLKNIRSNNKFRQWKETGLMQIILEI